MYACCPESVPICPLFVACACVAGLLRKQVLSDMFKCWRDAFEDFVPGLKAEWKAVFSNKVFFLLGGGMLVLRRVDSSSTAGRSSRPASRSVSDFTAAPSHCHCHCCRACMSHTQAHTLVPSPSTPLDPKPRM